MVGGRFGRDVLVMWGEEVGQNGSMATWAEFEAAEPEMAARAAELFRRRKHHVMATIRKDGSPRLSGSEVSIEGGSFGFGAMAGTMRALDLQRDPRVAFHCQGIDPPEHDHTKWEGEAKVSGRARLVDSPHSSDDGPPADYFTVDLDEVVLTSVASSGDHLVIEHWTPAGGLRRIQRH